MSGLLRASVDENVIAVIEDLIQDWGLDLEDGVTASTRVVAHLEFASGDIIQVCVAPEECNARKFGVQNLLMHDRSYIGDLSVDQIAQFIQSRPLAPQGNLP